jgi:AcrR family transcriptional regulator
MPATAKRQKRPGPGRLSAEDAAGLQDRLLDAAFELFTKRGYGDTSMEQIAKDAGASTKTLYSRFANKGEILEAVVRRNIERTVTRHVRSFILQPTEVEPREFLIKFGMQVALASLEAETLGMQRVTFAESVRWPGLRRMYREVNGGAVNVIERAMLLWRAQGKLDFTEDAHRLASLCYAMMTHEQRIGSILGDPMTQADARRYVELAVDVFLKGISPAPKAAAKKK